MSPPKYINIPNNKEEFNEWDKAREYGISFLKLGKLAVLTAAGGQGTRLGFNGPKGIFKVTPITKKSLFQVFAEKIFYAQKKYNVIIPWFIMTSLDNHEETINFFYANKFFNLKKVYFFQQDIIPALDNKGKIIMSYEDSFYMVPNGHGGIFDALYKNKCFEVLKKLQIELLSYFQVDNPLSFFIDPVFIGFHLIKKSEMSSKMVKKKYKNEKLGLFCEINNKLSILEYLEIPDYYKKSQDKNGNSLFYAGNTANHLLNVNFCYKVAIDKSIQLPYHCAKKSIEISNNGLKILSIIKFEKFIFDALKVAKNPIILEIKREEEFSPLKNSQGNFSLKSCIEDQNNLFANWLSLVNINIPKLNNKTIHNIEISPLFADNSRSFIEEWNNLENKPSYLFENFLLQKH